MKNVTLRQIRIFLSAVKHMNFTKAAEEIHITPSAVSLQIKDLEADIGVTLFLREGKQIDLTPAGEYFLIYARRMMGTLKEAESMMDRLKGADAKVLKIGLVSTAKYFVPRMLALFREEYPHVQVRLEVRNREHLSELLRDGEIDMAIMGRPPKDIDTRIEPFARHPHAFIASPGNPLVGQADIAPQALNQFDLITREHGSGTRIIMERYLASHAVSPVVTMEMSSNESIKQSVMADLGISFVSLHTIAQEIRNRQLVILDVHDTPIVRTWHVVALNRHNLSQSAEAFRYFMLERGGEILNQMFEDILEPRAPERPRRVAHG